MSSSELSGRLNEIHSSLIAGSRSASRDLFVTALRPIKAYLIKTHAGIREEDTHDLATDAILHHLREPQRFNAERASLWTYLCMTASADGTDLLRKRLRQQELLEAAAQDVELWVSRANDDVEMEMSAEARRIIEAHGHRLAVNDPERRFLALLLEGERSTAAFANVLGLDPSKWATTEMVKQVKDRLLVRLRRVCDEL